MDFWAWVWVIAMTCIVIGAVSWGAVDWIEQWKCKRLARKEKAEQEVRELRELFGGEDGNDSLKL